MEIEMKMYKNTVYTKKTIYTRNGIRLNTTDFPLLAKRRWKGEMDGR